MNFLQRSENLLENKLNEIKQKENDIKNYWQEAGKRLNEAEKIEKDIKEIFKKILNEIELRKEELEIKEKAIKKIIKEKTKGFPWLSLAISEFLEYFDLSKADYLLNKKYPAYKSSQIVKDISKEKRKLFKELKITKNLILYYENLFPWIRDYIDDDIDELIKQIWDEKDIQEDKDPVLKYMQLTEYRLLETYERNQLALDRYLMSRKSNWQIGKDYERFVGYLYEKDGYDVSYQGIIEGYEDLGRDLICKKGKNIDIVQCKHWSQRKGKVIREKHINQLFGTTIKYIIDQNIITKLKYDNSLFPIFNSELKIKPVFITSTVFSDVAKKFANALGVKLKGEVKLQKYPMIKCNINERNEKIYHLPFDQQYDKVKINKKGRFYAWTAKEAEMKGYRRAYKWRGNNPN